jgi:hypothetical protein
MTSPDNFSRWRPVCLSQSLPRRENRQGKINGRQHLVYVGDPMKLDLFRRTSGTFGLKTVIQRQCDKITRRATRSCGWHETLSDAVTTQIARIPRRSP